jgi:GH15 family glucan-1,4-alpha-glucosidase
MGALRIQCQMHFSILALKAAATITIHDEFCKILTQHKMPSHSLVNIMTGLKDDDPGLDSWYGVQHFSLLQNVQMGSEAHTTSYTIGTKFFLWGGGVT